MEAVQHLDGLKINRDSRLLVVANGSVQDGLGGGGIQFYAGTGETRPFAISFNAIAMITDGDNKILWLNNALRELMPAHSNVRGFSHSGKVVIQLNNACKLDWFSPNIRESVRGVI